MRRMLESSDQHVSLTNPDARSMATSGSGSGAIGDKVQVAVETEYHLIVVHKVTNVGSDRSQFADMAKRGKIALRAGRLEAVVDRGHFNSEEILACERAGVTVTLTNEADDVQPERVVGRCRLCAMKVARGRTPLPRLLTMTPRQRLPVDARRDRRDGRERVARSPGPPKDRRVRPLPYRLPTAAPRRYGCSAG
jgi:hypothetical protein